MRNNNQCTYADIEKQKPHKPTGALIVQYNKLNIFHKQKTPRLLLQVYTKGK